MTLVSTCCLVATLTSCDKTPTGNTSTTEQDEKECCVKFNFNYDGTYEKKMVKTGEKVTLPNTPKRPGYTFGGWYLDHTKTSSDVFDGTLPITHDVTVYARWLKNSNEHVVTFHYMDNITESRKVVVANKAVMEKPQDPSYPDGTKSFLQWYTDILYSTPYDFTKPVEQSFDLYAKWAVSKATVVFDYNYIGCPSPTQVTVELDSPMKEITVPEREHFAFKGWFTKAVGGERFDFSSPVTSDMTLFAHWEESDSLITFDINGGTLPTGTKTSTYVEKGKSAEAFASLLEEKLTYTGHDFKGWYEEKLNPDSDDDSTLGKKKADLSSLSVAQTFYAGWALSTYDVIFNLAYDGSTDAPETQKVKYGKLANEPAAPTREGYLFSGWYKDEALSIQFTFDMKVTEDITLYAKWIEDISTPENVSVKYYVDDTLYSEKSIAFNQSASTDLPKDPQKDNAIFDGWYTDKTFTTKFNTKANLTTDTIAYAKFLDRYTFEAEAIDFTDKTGQGTSTNSFEEQMIMDYTFVRNGKENVSNGYFVRELYYNGASLDFVIESDRAVNDASLYLRVSSESYEFMTTKEKNGVTYNYLSEEEFKIVVNGEWDEDNKPLDYLKYGGLYMPMANILEREDLAQNKTPFEDVFIAKDLALDKGLNYITLLVDNNNNHGGTFNAEAPIVDCMYIYSSATLTMHDYEFYKKPNVNRG